MKKIPLRKCVATNQMFPKEELLRVFKANDGSVNFDPSGKALGRGAYISKNKEAILKAKQKKILNKVFDTNVDDSLYEILLKQLS